MTEVESISASALPAPGLAPLALARELAGLGVRASFEDQDRLSYSRDMWPQALIWIRQGRIPPPPDAVVWPRSEEQVAEAINRARARRVAVVPYGGGSGVCGGTWAVRGGIALELKALDRIGEVDPERRCVEVQAGVMGEVLERKLNAQGYTLGHFPSSIYLSTVGGWLATRGAGQLSGKYGKIEDMVLALRAVSGRGELWVTPERPHRGPDLTQLWVGSEGVLGVITQARLRLFPVPEARAFRGFQFRTVAQGLEAIRHLYRAGLRPAVARLYDPFDTALVGREKPQKPVTPPSLRTGLQERLWPRLAEKLAPTTLGRPLALNKAAGLFRHCLLVLMFEGEAQRTEREAARALAICQRQGGEDLGEEPGKRWFRKRYDVSYKMSKVVAAGAFADTMEVAATWDKVLEVYHRVRAAVASRAFVLCHFSHAYLEGCSLYFTFTGSARSPQALERRYQELWSLALPAAVAAGATTSHHHGIGLLKAAQLHSELGEGRRLLLALKKVLDPDGIMNPGKLGL